jgi:hypothetical protein
MCIQGKEDPKIPKKKQKAALWIADSIEHATNNVYNLCVNHTEMIMSFVVVLLFIYSAYWLIKRRPGWNKKISTNTKTETTNSLSSTTLHPSSTMQSSSGQSTTDISSIRDRPSPNSIIRPNKFHARSDPTAWFIIFEAYLVQFNPSEWIYHVITAINEDCIANMPEINKFKTEQNGYEQLKNFMIEKYTIKKSQTIIDRNFDISTFSQRKQLCHENILDYARSLHKLGQQLFEGTTKLNDIVVKQFAAGLANMYAREVAWEKIGETDHTIPFDELAKFVQNKIEAKNRA